MNKTLTFALIVSVTSLAIVSAWWHQSDAEKTASYWLAVANAVAVINTAFIVWWYTEETARLRQTATEANGIALEANGRLRETYVVIKRVRDNQGGWHYVASNVGPGVAKTCVYAGGGEYELISALNPGETYRLRQGINDRLNKEAQDGFERRTHYMLAEGVDGRWYRTKNVVTPNNDISNVASPYTPTLEELDTIHDQTVSWEEKQAEMIRKLESS